MTEKARDYERIIDREAKIEDYADLEEFLFTVLPNSPKALFKGGEGFSRSRYFMREIGDPQDQIKSIHLAGTSGKGSTAYYLSGLLLAHNFRVGTHVSPHVFDLRERSMINLAPIAESEMLNSVNSFIPVIKKMDLLDSGRPTYFEVTVGNAFSIFARQAVDYAVIETGLGGLYDATNTITRTDKLALITKIGLDHTEVLGDTPVKIAYQKAGIIPKDGSSLVLSQPDDVVRVFKKVAKEKNSRLEIAKGAGSAQNIKIDRQGIVFDYNDGDLIVKDCRLSTIAYYQVENACLAIATLKYLAKRDGFDLNHDCVRNGLSQTVVPGRCEVRVVGGKTIILDGAHNPQKFASLVDSIQRLGLTKPPIWLLAFKKNKDVDEVIKLLEANGEQFVFSEFFRTSPNPNLRDYSINADVLASKLNNSVAISNSQRALEYSISRTDVDQLLIISGSIYFLGEINQRLHQAF